MGLLDEISGIGLSPEEERAIGQVEVLLRTGDDESRAVWINCDVETRVEDRVRIPFLKNVARHFARTGNATVAFAQGVPPRENPTSPADLTLEGPPARIATDRRWGQLRPYADIRRFAIHFGSRTDDELPSPNEIERGVRLPADRLPSRPYASPRGILWSTYAANLDRSLSILEICSRLGLLHRAHTLMVRLEYDAVASEVLSTIPTVIEAREYPAFQPAASGEPVGQTRDLRDNSPRYEEWVHGPLYLDKLVAPVTRATDDGGCVPPCGLSNGYLRRKP